MSMTIPNIAGRFAVDSLREQKVLKKLNKLGATSPESAKSPEEAGLTKKEIERLPSLLKENKIGKTKDDWYFIKTNKEDT